MSMNKNKGTARPIRQVFIVNEDATGDLIAVIYLWNTGEEQIMWEVERDSLPAMMRIRCVPTGYRVAE